MNLRPVGNHQAPSLNSSLTNRLSRADESSASVLNAPHVSAGKSPSAYSDIPGLSQLTQKLGQIPEVRREAVALAQAKVQSGEYLTRTAAESAAAELLRTEF